VKNLLQKAGSSYNCFKSSQNLLQRTTQGRGISVDTQDFPCPSPSMVKANTTALNMRWINTTPIRYTSAKICAISGKFSNMYFLSQTLFIIFILFITYSTSYSQQFQDLTNDDFNNFNHNPSLINLHESMVYGIRYRAQNTNIESNYQFTNLFMEYAIPYMDAGIGLNIEKESANSTNKYDVGLGYNYRIKFQSSGQSGLNLGVALNYLHLSADPDDFIVNDVDDPLISESGLSGGGLYAGMGASYIYRLSGYNPNHKKYRNEYILAALSYKNFFSKSPELNGVNFDLAGHYYMQLQGRFRISSPYQSSELYLEPGLLVSSSEFQLNHYMVHLNLCINDQFTVGGYYTSTRTMGIMFGYQLLGISDSVIPFLRASVSVSGTPDMAELGPGYYVSMGFKKKIVE